MIERVEYRPQCAEAEGLKAFFAEVLASLDARPRPLEVCVCLPVGAEAAIDLVDGNPVFITRSKGLLSGEGTASPADFRHRWLAEHPVPFHLHASRRTRLRFVPTDANRLKVRAA